MLKILQMANGGDFSQIMAEKPQKRPSKGILKTSSSFDKQDKNAKKSSQKATKWDEMNIIATLHPADKDYGHMKIEEPKTPYNYDIGEEDEVDSQRHDLDPSLLAEKLEAGVESSPRRKSFGTESEDSDSDLTPEELARKKVFKSKRKMHYNEFKVVEFARKLIKADEEALENEDDDDNAASSSNTCRTKAADNECEEDDNDDESNQSDSNVDDIRLQDCEDNSSHPASSERSSMDQNY